MPLLQKDAVRNLGSCIGCSRRSTGKRKLAVECAGEQHILIISDYALGDGFFGVLGDVYFEQAMSRLGLSLDDFWICSSVCAGISPVAFRDVEFCRQKLLAIIATYKPTVVITMGDLSTCALLSYFWGESVGSVDAWIGRLVPIYGHVDFWLCPLRNPAWLASKNNSIFNREFTLGLKTALEYDEPPVKNYTLEDIQFLYDADSIVYFLRGLNQKRPVAFDYETSGLKPHREGHFVACVGMCDGEHTVAFPVQEKTGAVADAFRAFLISSIPKVAHNLVFENIWSEVFFGVRVNNWFWDTILTEHILDVRSGITRLKLLAFAHFGVSIYNKDVDGLLQAEDSNAFNRIKEIPLNVLLKYCAVDTKLTHMLFKNQLERMIE